MTAGNAVPGQAGMSAGADLAIEVRGVRKSFGAARALDGVDLRVPAGWVHALLGPNGAGKTTLVRILATLLRPDAGTAAVAGLDVVADAAALRRRIGLTGQFTAVDPLLTGRENLQMTGRLCQLGRREAARRADELLERFSLAGAAGRLAKTYSGGMLRRLDLAASLIADPPVLILDEPTTGLDPRGRLDMWAAVEELAAGGTTVLLTTQYLEEADHLAHTVTVLDAGRVAADGTPGELKARLGGEVIELHASGADAAAAADALAGLGQASADPGRGRVTIPAPDGAVTLRDALDRLAAAQVAVDDIGLRHPSLDEVFLTLTGRRPQPGPDRAGAARPRRRRQHAGAGS